MKFNKASIEPDFSKSLISLIKIFSFEILVFHNLTISKGNLGDLKAINFMAVFHSLLKHSTKPLRHVINSRPMKKNNYPPRSLSLIIYVWNTFVGIYNSLKQSEEYSPQWTILGTELLIENKG